MTTVMCVLYSYKYSGWFIVVPLAVKCHCWYPPIPVIYMCKNIPITPIGTCIHSYRVWYPHNYQGLKRKPSSYVRESFIFCYFSADLLYRLFLLPIHNCERADLVVSPIFHISRSLRALHTIMFYVILNRRKSNFAMRINFITRTFHAAALTA